MMVVVVVAMMTMMLIMMMMIVVVVVVMVTVMVKMHSCTRERALLWKMGLLTSVVGASSPTLFDRGLADLA